MDATVGEFQQGMSIEQIQQQLAELLGPDAWRLTPATFAAHVSEGEWWPASHLTYIALIIAQEISKGNARIIVSMPARHGKSELLSIWTPIWALDRDPSTEIILASYAAELATDFSRKVRDWIVGTEHPDNPIDLQCVIRPDARRSTGFLTTKKGGMRAMGILGSITGRGADLFLVDDYIKNAKDAESPTIRQDIWDNYRSVVRTRLEPNASIVILATRWNLDDLIGRILAEDQDKGRWLYIDLSAMAEEGDRLGRSVGEPLWPERYDKAALEELKEDLGHYFWQSIFQQHPVPRSGGNVTEEDFPIVDIMPRRENLKTVRFWDAAGTEDGGDWSVSVKMSEDTTTGLHYVEDVYKKQVAAVQLEIDMAKIAAKEGPSVRIKAEQEPGSAGKNYISHLSRNVFKGYVFEGERATGDKFLRAQPFYACAQAGNVRLLRGKWNKKYIDEMVLFPSAPNDDQVDGTSGCYNTLNEHIYKGLTFGRRVEQDGNGVVRGIPQANTLVQGVTFGRAK